MRAEDAGIGGVLTAMVTPFANEGSVDHDAARRLAGYLLGNGSDGLVVAGSTGEASTLDDEEHIALLRSVVEEVGDRTTVVCGTGTNDSRHSVALTRAAEEAGADAVLVVAPYYNKPNRAGLVAHFSAVAGATRLPVILYNIPSRSVINMPPDLLAELARIENVVGLKQANNDELQPIEGLALLAGNDEIFLRTLEVGGAGGILVASHVVGPQMKEMEVAAREGDLERARRIDEELGDVYSAMATDTNPIPVKAAVCMLGLIGPGLRLPLVEADERVHATVERALSAHGLVGAR